MDGTPVAFADRESDLARMTILRQDDGRMVTRRRLPGDAITPGYQLGAFNDMWRHAKSGGRYVRHDEVYDLELGIACYDYSSFEDGRLWLRSIAEWHEIVDGRARFERLG